MYTDYFPAGYLAVLPASRHRLVTHLLDAAMPVSWSALSRSTRLQVRRVQISGPYLVIETPRRTLMWKRGHVDFHIDGRSVIAVDRDGTYELRLSNYRSDDLPSVTRNLMMFSASGAGGAAGS